MSKSSEANLKEFQSPSPLPVLDESDNRLRKTSQRSHQEGEELPMAMREGEDEHAITLEPISSEPYSLSYCCLLIPRFENHELSGDVVEMLRGWIKQICISFGWLLEGIDIRAGYLQWSLNTPVTIPPIHFMRIFRQYTSKRILSEFPRFRRENIADDFWAPGHLVIVGKRAHSNEMIAEFIRLTRQRQGGLPRR